MDIAAMYYKYATKVRSIDFGRVLLQERSGETAYLHLHHPVRNNLQVSLSTYCFS